jgi:hypothetical protein
MKIFVHTPTVERSYPMSVPNNAPEWIVGIVIVVAIIGLFAYGSRSRESDRIAVTPTHEMTQPPAVQPAPPPEPSKP